MPDELPDLTVPPPALDIEIEGEPSGTFRTPANLVVIDVRDAVLAKQLQSALVKERRIVAGLDAIGSAAVVIADVPSGKVEARVGGLRARMDAGGALLVLADEAVFLEAQRLGAAACLRLPFSAAELTGTIDRLVANRATEEHLARLSRELDLQSHLASLGRVASGLAHELANPLACVVTNVEALAERLDALRAESAALRAIVDATETNTGRAVERARALVAAAPYADDAPDIVRDISTQCDRMGELLQLMRELSARRPRTLEGVDLGALASDAVRLCPADLLRGVEVDIAIDEPVRVTANRLALEQLVVNLLTNGAYFSRKLASPQVRIHVYAAGDAGVVSVRDNGPGIPADLLDKIFEPFFTTRRREGGTGLGLALCREYASQMGARLSVWSVVGRGACFRVHLRRGIR
jgi:signal transduction histidine kinase